MFQQAFDLLVGVILRKTLLRAVREAPAEVLLELRGVDLYGETVKGQRRASARLTPSQQGELASVKALVSGEPVPGMPAAGRRPL